MEEKVFTDINAAISQAFRINSARKDIFCPRAHSRCQINCIEYTKAQATPVRIPGIEEQQYEIKGGICKHYGK